MPKEWLQEEGRVLVFALPRYYRVIAALQSHCMALPQAGVAQAGDTMSNI
jgi:hypothetical protein